MESKNKVEETVELTVDDLVPEIQRLHAEVAEIKRLLSEHTHHKNGAAVIRL